MYFTQKNDLTTLEVLPFQIKMSEKLTVNDVASPRIAQDVTADVCVERDAALVQL